jgi:flagellar biogenesis protein FliO
MSILQAGVPGMLRWLVSKKRAWRSRLPRQLCLRETLGLGERRFVAVVEFEQQRFLVGGTGNSLSMLANLAGPPKAEAAEEVPTWAFKTGSELRREVSSPSRCA